jgi:hypothetical protein
MYNPSVQVAEAQFDLQGGFMFLYLAKRLGLVTTLGLVIGAFMASLLYGTTCEQALTPAGVAHQYSDHAATIQNLASNKQFDVLTQHNDVARTGAATHENILTPSSVSNGSFGYLGAVSVTGKIYAQPLYVEKAAVACDTATGRVLRNANIAYVATLGNFVYAIDVDRQEVCWKTQKLGCGQPGAGLLGIDPRGEGGIRVGIVATPVIDLQKNVLYAITRNYDSSAALAQFFVNTIDTRTGTLIARVEVTGGATGCGGHPFVPNAHNNRPGLLLVNDKLFLAFGSTAGEDANVTYHGFVFGFDVSDPAHPFPMPSVFCTTPKTLGGGIWMSGGGLASDGSSIYFMTGNAAYVVSGDIIEPDYQVLDHPKSGEYPDSFVKLNVTDLSVQASYTDVRTASDFPGIPYLFDDPASTTKHTIFWGRERSDADLGSGGTLLLGNRVIGGGKDGRIDVLDVNGLARTQSFLAFFDADTDEGADISYGYTYNYYKPQYYVGPNIHGGPVAWDVRARPNSPSVYVYAWSEKDALKRFTFIPETGKFLAQDAQDASPSNPTPSPHGSVISGLKSMPGGMLSISANGLSDGIVWAVIEEPYPRSRSSSGRCLGGTSNPSKECAGCFLLNGTFVEYCDAKEGYVAGRLYAFAGDDNGIGQLPLIWGDKRSATPNNLIPRYSKFTPPTIAHGKVILATANDEVRFYGLRTSDCSSCEPRSRQADDIVAAWNDTGLVSLARYPSTGSTFEPHVWWKKPVADEKWGDSVRWLSGDFDGDGRSDAVAIWNDGGMNTLTLRRSIGTTVTTEQWAIREGTWVESSQWLVGDFNGDGLSDVAVAWNNDDRTSIGVYLSEGTHFEEPVQWALRDGGWDDSVEWVSGDFDGDGLSDIAAIWKDQGGMNTITIRKSTRSSFMISPGITQEGGWMDSTQWLAGDFNGDGRSDIAAVWNETGKATFAVYLSVGLQFAPHERWAQRDGDWDDSVKWVSGDFDGDGLSDIAAIWNDQGGTNTITVRKSTGSAFITKRWSWRDGAWLNSTKWLAGKFR